MRTGNDAMRQDRYAGLLATAATLSSEDLLAVVEDAQREIDAAHARQAVALAHLSAIEPVRQDDGTSVEVRRGLGHQRLDAPELAAPRMGVSVHVAANRVTDAIHQLIRTPAVVDAMTAGELDLRRAAVVTEETDILEPEDAAAVVDAVRPHWHGLTVGPLRRLVARTVAQLHPDAVAAEAERARERRGLTRATGEHGVDHWRADVLVEQSRLAWSAVTERARRLVRDGLADSLTQARADAMTQLILEHSDVRVVVHATRADDSGTHGRSDRVGEREGGQCTGRPNAWCEVGGLGSPGTTFVPARWLAATAGASAGASASTARGAAALRSADDARPVPTAREAATAGVAGRLTCHPVSGALLSGDVPAGLARGRDLTGASTAIRAGYRIPAAMARFVRLRDGGCRFPGCSVPARQCDLDHVRPWPAGPTVTTNLICLCRRHHRIKQRDGWSLRLNPDATVTWTDPTGRTSTTMPVDHLHLAASSRRTDPDPPSPRRHIDLSLLDDDLFELLADHHARDARRRHRRPERRGHLTFDAHELTDEPSRDQADWIWSQRAYEPPSPPGPKPDVIPF